MITTLCRAAFPSLYHAGSWLVKIFLLLVAEWLCLTPASAGTLTLTFATNVISEAAGPGATTATIKLDAPLTNALPLIFRGAVDTTKIFLPGGTSLTIPAGATNLSFAVDSVNNGDIDGDKTVTLTFGADSFANASASLLVTDDDTPMHRTIGGRLYGTVAGTNTYYVVDNLTILQNTTLAIQPGSQLLFPANLGLTCNGSLLATGSLGANIVFTRNPANANWPGINVANNTGQSVLNHVEIAYVNGNGLSITPPGSLPTLAVSNSIIHNCSGNGVAVTSFDNIYLNASTVLIANNTIYGNSGSGVVLTSEASQCNSSGNATSIIGNEIYNNQSSGIFLDASVYYNGCSVTCYTTVNGLIEGNSIHGNGTGITCLANTDSGTGANHIRELTSIIRNNLILNNTVNGISLSGGVQQNLAPVIVNNTIAGNGNAGIYHVTRQVGFTFENNLLIQNNYGIQSQPTFNGLGVVVKNNDAWGNYIGNWANYPVAYGLVVTNNLNGTGADTNLNISADPQVFTSGIDFHLTVGSPAIDAGLTNQAPTNDIVMVKRHGFPDIGCYEYGSLFLTPAAPVAGGTFNLQAAGGRGTPFTIQTTTDFKTWSTVTNSTLTNRTAWLSLPATNGSLFYRAQIN
jgi:hypothetical protein